MARNHRSAAQSIARLARRQITTNVRHVELAIVTSPSPLTAELVDGSLTLSDDILILSSAARRYANDYGIEVGDALVLVQLSSAEYLVMDVQSENAVMQGVGTTAEAGTTKVLNGEDTSHVAVTVNMVVAHWLEAYDADGNSIGFVPVFASKT